MIANTLLWLFFQEEPSPLLFVVFLVVGLVIYAFFAFCLLKIAEKTHTEPAWWAWVPILQILLMLKVADKPLWWIILMFIPLVGIVITILVWVAICQKRNKSPLLVIGLLLIPFVFLPYLAFSD